MDLALAFNVRGLNCKLVFPSRRWFKSHGIPATGVLHDLCQALSSFDAGISGVLH